MEKDFGCGLRFALVLVNDLCENLRCLYIGVFRQLADRFNRRFEGQEACTRYFFKNTKKNQKILLEWKKWLSLRLIFEFDIII